MLAVKKVENDYSDGVFFMELHRRIRPLPIRSSSGNECVSIVMTGSAREFQVRTEEFISCHSDCFHLMVKGQEYYVELVDFEHFVARYEPRRG